MYESKAGLQKASKAVCQNLLAAHQVVLDSSRFSDDIFGSTCGRLQSRNEAKVIQDIPRLIVPSAEKLTDFGAGHL